MTSKETYLVSCHHTMALVSYGIFVTDLSFTLNTFNWFSVDYIYYLFIYFFVSATKLEESAET